MEKSILALIVVLLLIGLYIASGFIIMLIWNVLARYFEFKEINLFIGCMISLALTVVGSVFKK